MREMLPGFLTAVSLAVSLLLLPTLFVQAGADFMGVYTASMFMAIAGCLIFGRLGLPVAAAPSAALSAWLVSVIILAHGVSWQMVLFMGAAVSLVLTLLLGILIKSGRLKRLGSLFPACIADGLRGALGLMLVFQGFYQGHLLLGSPTGLLQLGNLSDPVAYLSLAGIIAMLALMAVKNRFAVLGGVFVTALLAFIGGFWVLPDAPFFLPEGLDKTGLQLIFMNGWDNIKACDYVNLTLFLLLYLCFTSWGGLAALMPQEKRQEEGRMAKSVLTLSGLSFVSCLLGSMPLAPAPESAVGQSLGGRSGRMAYFTAAFLLLLLFAEPTMKSMASFTAILAPALFGAGLVLLQDFARAFAGGLPEKTAAGLLFLLLPLTQNIAAGIGAACIAYVSLKILAGESREVSVFQRLLAVLFILYFFFGFWSIV
ncbi:MAG: hypothetical protein ACI4OH_03495 [Mitsuokella sp.]|uniref:hypothetical protein n=1 Tax=Mitsuokella sp. TaxID=2049034 RepID=UPI003F0D47BA